MPQRTEAVAARQSTAMPSSSMTSTIVPNPISSLSALTPEVAVDAIGATSSPMADAPTDLLDDQLSNELASEAIDEIISTDAGHEQQMDITDAIGTAQDAHPRDAAVPAEPNEANATSENDAMAPSMGDTPAMPLTTSDETTAPPRARFIPAAAIAMPDEDSVAEAVETPVARSASLINKISGLWSSKPVSKPAEAVQKTQSEPSLETSAPKSEVAVSILDLSRADAVNKAVATAAPAAPNADEDDLDIPAFLRRQAN